MLVFAILVILSSIIIDSCPVGYHCIISFYFCFLAFVFVGGLGVGRRSRSSGLTVEFSERLPTISRAGAFFSAFWTCWLPRRPSMFFAACSASRYSSGCAAMVCRTTVPRNKGEQKPNYGVCVFTLSRSSSARSSASAVRRNTALGQTARNVLSMDALVTVHP